MGVPQGSILGPLLFNVFINDLLYIIEKTDICNFADDNTIYTHALEINEVVLNLKHDLRKVLSWFSANQLVANPAKFQMLILGSSANSIIVKVGNTTITSSDSVKLLGITIDKELLFRTHIENLCRKASNYVRSLYRIRNVILSNQLKLLNNSYILSAFSYAPIIWMFCNKYSSKAIDSVHKRALRAVCGRFDMSYEDLLHETGSKTIHHIHLRHLLCEIYKTIQGLNPPFMQEIFISKESPYQLRSKNLLVLPAARSSHFGTNTFLFRGSLLWNSIPDKLKNATNLQAFKHALGSYNLTEFCRCKVCV